MNKSAKKSVKKRDDNKLVGFLQEAELSDEAKALVQKVEDEQSKIDEAEQAVAKQRSKKKKIWSFIFFMINIGVVVAIFASQLATEDLMSFSELLSSNLNYWFLLLALVFFGLMVVTEIIRFAMLTKQATGRNRPFLGYKTFALGKYYDCITPMSTGGEPFQIFYMKSRGLSASAAISVPMGRYILCQIATIIVSTVAIIIASTNGAWGGSTVVSVACYIGYALNLLVVVVTIFLSVSKNVGKKIVVWVLKFLHKLHIVKNYEAQYNKVLKVVNDYQTAIQDYAKHFWHFLLLLFLSILNNLITYIIPFFIVSAFIGFDSSLIVQVMVMGVMIEMAASFIPLPGGTGMSELSFTALFGSLIDSSVLFWALLMWRFMNYYIYILQGIIVMIYDYFIGNRKYQWQKKKWELEAESIAFKEEKIKSYKRSKSRLGR